MSKYQVQEAVARLLRERDTINKQATKDAVTNAIAEERNNAALRNNEREIYTTLAALEEK